MTGVEHDDREAERGTFGCLPYNTERNHKK